MAHAGGVPAASLLGGHVAEAHQGDLSPGAHEASHEEELQGAGQISAEQLEVPGEEGHEEDLHQPQEVHAEVDLLEEDHEGGLHRHQEGLWEEDLPEDLWVGVLLVDLLVVLLEVDHVEEGLLEVDAHSSSYHKQTMY